MKKTAIALLGLLLLVSCEEVPLDKEPGEKDSLFERLKREGDISGAFTPFTLIDRPQYQSMDSAVHMVDDDLVLLLKKEGQIYVYPHKYMYVEVVNEFADGHPIAITFCPLTRSGLAWDRVISGDTTILTASGYLFKENLMPLDTTSGSIFSQMLSEGISGFREGYRMNNISILETKWSTVVEFFPESVVLDPVETLIVCGEPGTHSTQTSSIGSQKSAQVSDPHFLGIPGSTGVMLYGYDQFPGEIHTTYAMDVFGNKRILFMAGSDQHRYIVPFLTSYHMIPLDTFPVILEDETGTRWDVFGEAVSGPRKGEKLESPHNYVALDWAWDLLYDLVRHHVPNSSEF